MALALTTSISSFYFQNIQHKVNIFAINISFPYHCNMSVSLLYQSKTNIGFTLDIFAIYPTGYIYNLCNVLPHLLKIFRLNAALAQYWA